MATIESAIRRDVEYPLNNVTYDLVALLRNMSDNLRALTAYQREVQGDPELAELLQRMWAQQATWVRELEPHLAKRLHHYGPHVIGEPW